MVDIVFLPATEPGDKTYGEIPERIDGYPDIMIHQVRFPGMVWYNKDVRRQAIAQIRRPGVSSVILVGFSKSGLGAWDITREIPELISGTIIFDAPVAREELPPWGTSPFYKDNFSWLNDLPVRNVDNFQNEVPRNHKLILISGENFHNEMTCLVNKLYDTRISYVFLSRPCMHHHWQSGWIEEGLRFF
jgi:hypothetical protein